MTSNQELSKWVDKLFNETVDTHCIEQKGDEGFIIGNTLTMGAVEVLKSAIVSKLKERDTDLLKRLKEEADRPFGNVKQMIYLELDKVELSSQKGKDNE